MSAAPTPPSHTTGLPAPPIHPPPPFFLPYLTGSCPAERPTAGFLLPLSTAIMSWQSVRLGWTVPALGTSGAGGGEQRPSVGPPVGRVDGDVGGGSAHAAGVLCCMAGAARRRVAAAGLYGAGSVSPGACLLRWGACARPCPPTTAVASRRCAQWARATPRACRLLGGRALVGWGHTRTADGLVDNQAHA